MLRWVEVKADNRFQLLGELRIGAQLEGLHQVRLQAVSSPDASHAGLTDADGGGHGAGGPMGGVVRPLLSGLANHPLHRGRRDARRAPGPRRILFQTRDAGLQKSFPPTSCFLIGDPQLQRDVDVLLAVGRQQNNVCPFHLPRRKRAASRPLLQRLPLIIRQSYRLGHPHQNRLLNHRDVLCLISITTSDALH